MNLSGLEKKLIAAARTNPPGDNVPYAFEKRIMALLPRHPVDVWGLWAHGLSRAAALCVIAALLLGAGTFFLPAASHPDNLSQDVETTLLAAAGNPTADAAAESE